LEITGDDLIELGFERGPKLGLALKHALAALLDGQANTSQAQLKCAVDFLKQGT
jgi:hypothetical protein